MDNKTKKKSPRLGKSIKKNISEIHKLEKYVPMLMDNAFGYFILLDHDMKIRYLSSNFLKLVEIIDDSNVIGMPAREAFELFKDKNFSRNAADRMARIMSGENDFHEEDTITLSTGEKRICRINFKRITDNDFDGTLVFFNDITQLRIEDTERHLNGLLYSTTLPCQIWDENGDLVAYNKEAMRVFGIPEGFTPEEYGRFFLSKIQPKYQSDGTETELIRQKAIHESLEKGFASATVQLNKADGTPVYFTANATRISCMFNYQLVIYFYDMTEMMMKDAQIKEAEEHTKLMLDATPLGCSLWDKNLNIIDYNEETNKMFALPNKHSFADYFFRLSPKHQPNGELSSTKAIENINETFEKGYLRFEWMHQDFNGEPIPTEVTLVRVKRADDFIVAGYTRDLREYKRIMEKADEANERMQLMLDSMPLTATFINEDFEIIDCNQAAVNLFEVSSKSEYINRFYDLSPKYQPCGRLSRDMSIEILSKAISEGYNYVGEWMHQKLNGELIPCEITLICKDKSSIIGYARDLREVKAALEEANEANVRNKLMLDINPLMCVMRDDKGNIIDCNQEALNISGVFNKREFCEKFYDYFLEYQADGLESTNKKEELAQFLEGKDFITIERTMQTPAGELIPLESRLVRIPWKNTYHYLSFSRDLREERAKEQRLLEVTERERKAELQREAAEAATEAKGRFLASMSHEIRTPMNTIVGMSELLLQEEMSKRQLRYAKDIKTSAMALLDIINDILDVSKIHEGRLSLVPVNYDFNTMIDGVASIAQFLVENKNITFKLILQNKIPRYVYGDDIRIRQVLLNLLSNAIKFTEKGDIRLIVNATDTTIRFTVTDTGIGIQPEDISRLFVAFEQLDTLKNRSRKGTGLGLTISKSLVELMGGRIFMESVYGQGSSFHVEIPKVLGNEAQIKRTEDNEIEICTPNAKVLVVDDNEMNLNVASGLLGLYQIKAETATSGQQAIDLIKKNHYDIVFMDHMMPEMTGIEATKIIRNMDIKVTIIALTASAVIGAREKMLSAGMNDYLPKPIINTELKRILKNWLPSERFLTPPPKKATPNKIKSETHEKFWNKIDQIEDFSSSLGLNRTGGQRDVYENTLRLMIKEIEKCDRNLKEFLAMDDMRNFCIEVHGMKSSLANIGATELVTIARALEIASSKSDTAFCALNLPTLLDRLNSLRLSLKEAFAEIYLDDSMIEIPPELPPILSKIMDAFDKIDLMLIDEKMKKLNALNLSDALKEKIKHINDAVMIMDYEGATEQIRELFKRHNISITTH